MEQPHIPVYGDASPILTHPHESELLFLKILQAVQSVFGDAVGKF